MEGLIMAITLIVLFLILPAAYVFEQKEQKRRQGLNDILFYTPFSFSKWLVALFLWAGFSFIIGELWNSLLPYTWLVPIISFVLFLRFWYRRKYTYIKEDCFANASLAKEISEIEWYPLSYIHEFRYTAVRSGYWSILHTALRELEEINITGIVSNTEETLEDFLKRKGIPGYRFYGMGMGEKKLW